MKKLFLIILVLGISFKGIAQIDSIAKSRFQGSVAYGLGFVGITPDLEQNNIVLKRSNTGTFLSATLEYEVAKDKFLGAGYGFKQFVNTLDQVSIRELSAFVLEDYKNVAQHHYYDLHLRRKYDNFNITVGLTCVVERYGDVRQELIDQEYRVYFLFSEPSPTPITAFLALDYTFPINPYMDIGLQGRIDYGSFGVDNVALSPLLRLKF